MSKPRFSLKYSFRTALAKGLLYLMAPLPLWLSQGFGALVGRMTYRIPNDIRHAADINLGLCLPELDAGQRRRLLRQYLIETGKTAMESPAMWLWGKRRIMAKVKQVSGREYLDEAMSRDKGVIFAMPHLGAWEIAALWCSKHYPMTTLYRPPTLASMGRVIRRGRERFGARLVPTDNQGVRALLQALKQGETIGILPDQEPGRGQGEFAPFFGIPAYTMTLVSRLTQKTGATVVMCYAERLARGRGYHLHFLKPPAEIADTELKLSLAALNHGVEACIRPCPAQYQWGYRRFKTRPEGESGLY